MRRYPQCVLLYIEGAIVLDLLSGGLVGTWDSSGHQYDPVTQEQGLLYIDHFQT